MENNLMENMEAPVDANAHMELPATKLCDKAFLIDFIYGNYVGPDVSCDCPRSSIMVWLTQGLSYESSSLGTESLTVRKLEWLYEYILKDAAPRVTLSGRGLLNYFNNTPSLKNLAGFYFFFPPELHAQENSGRRKIFKGTVVVPEPNTSHISPNDLDRFMSLTGRNEVKINMEEFQPYCDIKEKEFQEKRKIKLRLPKKPVLVQPLHQVPLPRSPIASVKDTPSSSKGKLDLKLVCTGTATQGELGHAVGRVDIGVQNEAYFFRVSVPGVDPDTVKCLVDSGGEITVKGVTQTGERRVTRNTHKFIMRTNNLPPSGAFKVSFRLPGPVDSGSWEGTVKEGLLEGFVRKAVPE